MKIKLLDLGIENFKGIKKFDLKLNGKSGLITGKNGTGKTTIADAFFWLISDADSEQQSKFNIIELDDTGTTINHQDASVSAVLDCDEKNVTLKKIYRQKWTKKRGQAEAEFAGHQTKYFFDDIPTSKKEFDQRLKEIIDPGKFRILADTQFFCTQTKPEDRRRVLVELVGDVSDAAICDQFNDLAPLKPIIEKRSLDDHKKILQERRKKLNQELKELPVAIAAKNEELPDTGELDQGQLQIEINKLESRMDYKKNEILALSSGLAVIEKEKEISRLEIEMNNITRDINFDTDKMRDLQRKKNEVAEQLDRAKIGLKSDQDQFSSLENDMKVNQSYRDKLKKDWQAAQAEKFTADNVCFACGQSIPAEKISAQEYEFNAKKAVKIKSLDETGMGLYDEYKKMNAGKDELYKKINDGAFLIAQLDETIRNLEEQIKVEQTKIRLVATGRSSQIAEQIRAIQDDIDEQRVSIDPARKRLENELSELKSKRYEIESQFAKFSQVDQIRRSVEKLEQQLRDNAEAFENTEHELYLIDLFSRKKSEYIEANVNDKFAITKFKLFETQVNQGVREICEPIFEGVPYSTDLNTGARINVGIDIINVLSAHYDLSCPVFVDHAESVTSWIDSSLQMIKLIASNDFDDLEVLIDG